MRWRINNPMGRSSYTNYGPLCIIDDPPQCRDPLASVLARVMNTQSPGAAVINPSMPIWKAGATAFRQGFDPLLASGVGFPCGRLRCEGRSAACSAPRKVIQCLRAETRARACCQSLNHPLESGSDSTWGFLSFCDGSSPPAISNWGRYLGMYGTMSLRNEARRGKYSSLQGRNTALPYNSVISTSRCLARWISVVLGICATHGKGGTEQSDNNYKEVLKTPGILSQ